MSYVIHAGNIAMRRGKIYRVPRRTFDTLDAARMVASRIFNATGVVVSITQETRS